MRKLAIILILSFGFAVPTIGAAQEWQIFVETDVGHDPIEEVYGDRSEDDSDAAEDTKMKLQSPLHDDHGCGIPDCQGCSVGQLF